MSAAALHDIARSLTAHIPGRAIPGSHCRGP